MFAATPPWNVGIVKAKYSFAAANFAIAVLNTVSSTALSIFFKFKISYSNLAAKLPMACASSLGMVPLNSVLKFVIKSLNICLIVTA